MPLQHYLPATYIACFSTDTNRERRRRIVWVGDRRKDKIFSRPASKVCGINNFYTLADSSKDPNRVDDAWSLYEKDLAPALDQLINGTITCLTWARTLVLFVAGLLVRGPDFNERFENRLLGLGIAHLAPRDNTNEMRLFERQRLLASVLGAKWMLLKARSGATLISNDLGYALFINPTTQDRGIAIPINLEHVLVIVPQVQRQIAIGLGGTWWPLIYSADLIGDNHLGLNQAMADFSQRFIFGPDRETVKQYLNVDSTPPQIPEPGQLGLMDGEMARIHEMTWFRLMAALAEPPTEDSEAIIVDFSKNSNSKESSSIVKLSS